MSSVSQPAHVAKHERERGQFAVAAYYDYCTHVLTRQLYLRKVCYGYGPICKTVVLFCDCFSRGFGLSSGFKSMLFFVDFSMRFCTLFHAFS